MSRILLLCPEPLGHRQPAGVGIRFIEFVRALAADGHQVTLLTPDGGGPEGCEKRLLSPQSIAEETAACEAAVVQGHSVNELFAHGATVPTAVDLYDPWIIENFHYRESRGDEVFVHDHATLMRSMARGDFFLCASEEQRLFYLGALLAAGRLNPRTYAADPRLDSLLSIVPFGVPPVASRKRAPGGSDVLFGGIYDWYDARLAIDAAAIAKRTIAGLTLTFMRHPNAATTPQSEAAAAAEHVRRNGYSDFVRFEPWAPYAARQEWYGRFAAALLTFPQSLETDLSMRTRIFDYLWAGLPVVTSSARGTDRVIRTSGAGEVVESANPADFAAALIRLLQDGPRYVAAVSGALAWAAQNQWPRLLTPLLDFCRNPRTDPMKDRYPRGSATVSAPPRTLIERIRRRMGGAA